MPSARVLVVWSTVLPAAAMLAACRDSSAPPRAAVVATQPGAPARENLHAAAVARRIGAFQRLRDAQEAERSGRLTEARNLYAQALELDPTNVAAKVGHDRVIAQLNEAPPPQQRSETERQIIGNSGPIRYDFNTALEESNKAVAAKQFEQARSAWRRARDAALRNPQMFPPSEIEKFQAGLRDLDRLIRQAESAEIAAMRRAGQHAAAARIESQREADDRDRQKAVRERVGEARRMIESETYGWLGPAIDEILFLDPHNDFALGARPLLKKITELLHERRRLGPPATNPSASATELIHRGQEAEVAGRFAEARNLYHRALEWDRGVENERKVIPYIFKVAVEEGNRALSAHPPKIDEAWASLERSRATALQNPAIFPPETIRDWNNTMKELHRRILDAEEKARDARTSRDRVQ
jgi:tetratricopeptide (TPR) repeat protein